MKIFATTLLLGLTLSAWASEEVCEISSAINVQLPAVVKTIAVSTAPEAQLNCPSAFLEYLNSGEFETESPEKDLFPVILVQTFTEEQAAKLDVAAIMGAAYQRKVVLSFIFEGDLMVLRAVHVKYKNLLDR